MAESKPLHTQLDQEALRKWGRDLAAAFDTLAGQMRAGAKRMEQAREVGALFDLYRSEAEDRLPRIQAALEGYDPAYLVELASFGAFLAQVAQRERDRKDEEILKAANPA
jgi:hypothetical protein